MESRLNVHTGEIPRLPDHIRFVCLSDTHDRTNSMNIPQGDVILHSGDFTRAGDEKDVKRFESFLSKLPHRNKIVIAGNHDLTFDLENYSSLQKNFTNLKKIINPAHIKGLLKSCTYLEDSSINIGGYKIYGSPWTPTFFDWAFNLDRGANISAKWDIIESDTDILLTHGPPHGILDMCHDGVHAGCEALLIKVLEIKPLVHLFGHIHEGYGVLANENTTFINGSNCNLRYQPNQPPYVFDLPIRN